MKIFRVFIIILAGLSLASLSTDAAFTSQVTVSGNQFSTGTWVTPTPTPTPTPSISPTPFQKITICHATGSEKNPYVEITISTQGELNGHLPHHDDIIPAPAEGCPGVAGGASVETTPSASPTPTPIPSETLE